MIDLKALEADTAEAVRKQLEAGSGKKDKVRKDGGDGRRSFRKSEHDVPPDPGRTGNHALDDNAFDDVIQLRKEDRPPELEARISRLQELNDHAMIVASLLSRPLEGRIVRPEDTDFFKSRVRPWLEKNSDLVKQMDTATAGEGSEWVPRGYSAQLYELIQSQLPVAGQLDQVQMPRGTWEYPITSGRPTAYLGSEQTGDESTKTYAASNPTTGRVTLTAKKIGIRIPLSEELEEDSIVPVVAALRNNMAYHLSRNIEDSALNSDTATPHMDNDVTAATDRRKAWIGLRAQAVDLGGTVSLSTFSAAKLRQLISTMGEYGSDDPQRNLCIVTGPKAYWRHFANLADATRTDPSLGGGGLVNVGGRITFDGIQVLGSPVAREDLNTVGVRDSTTQDNSHVLVFYKPAWKLAVLRGPRMRSWLSTLYDQMHLIADWRGFLFTPWTTTEKHVVLGVDVDVS